MTHGCVSLEFEIYTKSSFFVDMAMTHEYDLTMHDHVSQKTHALTFKLYFILHITIKSYRKTISPLRHTCRCYDASHPLH